MSVFVVLFLGVRKSKISDETGTFLLIIKYFILNTFFIRTRRACVAHKLLPICCTTFVQQICNKSGFFDIAYTSVISSCFRINVFSAFSS